jgi:signal transduction histidine kinase
VIARNSLALRLFAGAAAWAVVLLLLGAIALTTLYQRSVLKTMDDRLINVAEALVAAAETDPDGVLTLARRPSDPAYGRVFSGRYWQIIDPVVGEDGIDRLVSRSLWDETLYVPPEALNEAAAQAGQVVSGESKGPGDEPLYLIVQSIVLPDRDMPVIMIAAEDRRPADRDVRNFAITSGVMFIAFAAAIAAGVFFQVRIGLSPVLRMRTSVADVREGRSEHVDGQFPSELQPLADELNAMLDHSRELVERSRTHVGNLAHALKTPLAVLSNESRESDGKLADMVSKQSEIMSKQVDHHLRRARAAAHAKAMGARTDVGPMLEDLTRTLTKIYAHRDVVIDTSCEANLKFRGERQDLDEMVGNLLDNACKWAAGQVRVSALLGEDGRLNIRIEDDGPGVDETEAASALLRGVRLDEQAPGTGLGLAIVSDLARAYEGEVSLSRSDMGGLNVLLELPAPPR